MLKTQHLYPEFAADWALDAEENVVVRAALIHVER